MDFSTLKVLKVFISSVFCVASVLAAAQNVTIINNYNGGGDSLLPENYVLRSVTEHTYIINEFEPSNTGTRSLLDQMVTYGLRSYIDNSFHVFDDRAQALTPSPKFLEESAAVVRNALWIHELPFADEFPGFSRAVKSKVDALRGIDGYSILYANKADRRPDDGTMGLYVFQRMVYDLKTAVEKEAFDFIDKYMPQTQTRGYDNLKGAVLVPGDYQLPDQDNVKDELAGMTPDRSLVLSTKGARNPVRDVVEDEGNFNQQIVKLLEDNNRILANYSERFADMQRQIDELRESRDDDIRREMAAMRQMIEVLAGREGVSPSAAGATDGEVEVIFAKNQHDLTLAQKAQLNRVQIALAKNPRLGLLITGYADKSGNPAINAWISQERAKSVERYLVQRGIARDKMTVSFVGDAESTSVNPNDRKVVVSFVNR